MLRSTKKTSVENTLVFCFIRYLKFHPQGWIRTAAATSLKTAQKQPSATATTAASGRSREELLGLRPAGCACRPRHDAAAGSRDPGSFLFCAARDIHPRPPKNLNVRKYAEVFVLLQSQTHWAGGFEQQRSRPPPAAETGRRGWGSAPLFQSPAKGLQKKRQAQLVRPAVQSGGQKSPCGAFLDARLA